MHNNNVTAKFVYLVLPDSMRDNVPLSRLQSLVGQWLKSCPHTVVTGGLQVYTKI